MITFYIDESGKFNVNDPIQNINLFACVAIHNKDFLTANNFINTLKDEVMESLLKKINGGMNSARFNRPQKQAIKDLMNSYIKDDFELHMNKIWQGKDKFKFLNLEQKKQIVEKTIKFLDENNIEIVVVKTDYNDVLADESIYDKQKFIDKNICSMLLKKCEEYAENLNDKGVMIIDQGNVLIEKAFRTNFWENPGDTISPDIALVESHKSNLIQLADIMAYTINLYLNGKLEGNLASIFNDYKEKIKFYDIYTEFVSSKEIETEVKNGQVD